MESWKFDGWERVRPVDGPQDGSNDVCHVYSRERESRGPLIAAAPDLLAACEAVLPGLLIMGGDWSDENAVIVQAAIAKAKAGA